MDWHETWSKSFETLGCATYVHDPSHKHGKLGSRGKKSIFVRYWTHSKGYVFIGDQASESVTEFESRDAFFLENEFPSRGEINQNLSLYEIEDLDSFITRNHLIYLLENVFKESNPSGSEMRVSKFVSCEPQIRKSSWGHIPWRYFY